jgi:hypothetical protein
MGRGGCPDRDLQAPSWPWSQQSESAQGVSSDAADGAGTIELECQRARVAA